jgi:hypothetical protein
MMTSERWAQMQQRRQEEQENGRPNANDSDGPAFVTSNDFL